MKRDNYIAMVGEFVKYNGKIGYAQNSKTQDLMKEFLEVGKFYEILETITSRNFPITGRNIKRYFYKFKTNGGCYWYPSESFYFDIRETYKNRYDLI